MHTVSIQEAKTHLSKLLEEVSKGEEVIITQSGRQIAKLMGLVPAKSVRKPGFLKGKIKIADNFDATLPDGLFDAFDGKS